MPKVRRIVWSALGWTLTAAAAVLLGAALWIRRTFGPISVDQLLLHLPGAGGEAPTAAEGGYLTRFIWQAVVIPLLVVALVGLLLLVRRRRRGRRRAPAVPGPYRSASPSSSVGQHTRWLRPLLVAASCVVGATFFIQSTGLAQYVGSSLTSWTMDEYYVVPAVESTARTASNSLDEQKNLVLIFLESGEEAFSDTELFEENMLQPLESATEDWARFERLDVYNGGGWTMAGLVGTECGVPLRGAGVGVSDINSNEIGADAESYMPGAVCLGDVLADAGYRNVFLGGADASFASKEDFLRSHGYDEVKDLKTWQAEGETEFSEWGLSDRGLMEQAKAEVSRLHESGQPFNLTVLTLDTHEPVPDFDYCPVESEEPAVSAYRCSFAQVAGFIDYMREMGYLEDTAVFITGDHPKMIGEGGVFYAQLSPLGERPLFNRLWDPEHRELARLGIDQLSVYATLLDVLGLGREDGRAGVGVSAFVPSDSGTGVLGLSPEDYAALIESRSGELYRRLWGGDEADISAQGVVSER